MVEFKKKTTLSKANSQINGEWGGQDKQGKRITSSKRRMLNKQLIRDLLKEG